MPSCAFRTLPACCPIIVALLQILTVTVLAPFEQLETQTSLTVSRLPIRHPRRTADATASVVSLKDEMTWHRLAHVACVMVKRFRTWQCRDGNCGR
jgi:hypothetical protein